MNGIDMEALKTVFNNVPADKLNEIISAIAESAKEDKAATEIINNGFVKNTKLHRRFVMAQMFKMLNTKVRRWNGRMYPISYDEALRAKGIKYQMKYLLGDMKPFDSKGKTRSHGEIEILGILEREDKEAFAERSRFLTRPIITSIFTDYLNSLQRYFNNLKEMHYEILPYRRIPGEGNFTHKQFNKRFVNPVAKAIVKISDADSYKEIYSILCSALKNNMYLDNKKMQMSSNFISSYKGNGAFYTLKNMFLFHDCTFEGKKGQDALKVLNERIDEMYSYEFYKVLGILRSVIEKEHFDFAARMREVYKQN